MGLIFVGCGEKDGQISTPEGNKYYQEGPHVFIDEIDGNAVYFAPTPEGWKMEQQYLPKLDGSVLSVQNPAFEAFDVKINRQAAPVPSEYPEASKITVLADIEGNFMALYSMLVAREVIDEAGNWIYGDGHLVMLGDLFDRGPDVTPTLWLLYKLEQEARASGGHVHTLLGNHEIMIFQGDTRYVNGKYIKQHYDTGFKYPELYAKNTILGDWLRSKPAIIKIGDKLFAHAGISLKVLELNLDLDQMNNLVRAHNASGEEASWDAVTATILGTNGIFWYRGWVENPPPAGVLDAVLGTYDANHMIVGHTIVPEIRAAYDHKLVMVDLKQPKSLEAGPVRALSIENRNFYEVNNRGDKKPVESI